MEHGAWGKARKEAKDDKPRTSADRQLINHEEHEGHEVIRAYFIRQDLQDKTKNSYKDVRIS